MKRFIGALLTSRNVRSACSTAGISERTAYRWLADPTFRAALHEAEAQLLDGVARRLLALAEAATDHLGGVLTGPMTTDQARLRAIDLVLGHLLKLRELNTLEARIARLEEAINGDTGTKA